MVGTPPNDDKPSCATHANRDLARFSARTTGPTKTVSIGETAEQSAAMKSGTAGEGTNARPGGRAIVRKSHTGQRLSRRLDW